MNPNVTIKDTQSSLQYRSNEIVNINGFEYVYCKTRYSSGYFKASKSDKEIEEESYMESLNLMNACMN